MKTSSGYIANTISDQTKKSFGEGTQFVVDVDYPSPTGVEIKWAYCLTNVTGFDYSSTRIDSAGGTIPGELSEGIELPAGLMNISVDTGSILCFLG